MVLDLVMILIIINENNQQIQVERSCPPPPGHCPLLLVSLPLQYQPRGKCQLSQKGREGKQRTHRKQLEKPYPSKKTQNI